MTQEILLAAPYRELAELAEKVKKDIDVQFEIITGNLDESWEKIDAFVKGGGKVILSRGGTAELLRERLAIPVADIPVTSFDILTAISQMNRKGIKKIAFITMKNIIAETHLLNEFFDVVLCFEPVMERQNISDKVRELLARGYEVIVGDVNAWRYVQSIGARGQLLQSGYESVRLGLQEAQRILEAQKREMARAKQMEAILNMISEGVLSVDGNGYITSFNNSAEKIFGYAKEELIGRQLAAHIPESRLMDTLEQGRHEQNFLMEIHNDQIISNRIPILLDGEVRGAVAIFEKVSHIQNLELNIRTKLSETGLQAKFSFSQIETASPQMQDAVKMARKYADSDGTVVIYGETGTGKEVFAQSIHNGSKRAKEPFVSVNCAALNENLLESELFGYEEGAFTGARKGGKRGLFELAHGGSIFLDEIGEISLSFQAKLLRVLQEREVRRVGGHKVIPIDVRVLCATNRDLSAEMLAHRFREDLYYRLTVLELALVPLRARKEDIIPLAKIFLKEESVRERKNIYWHDDSAFECLLAYAWWGNARELHNFINRLVICSDAGKLNTEMLDVMMQQKMRMLQKGDDFIRVRIQRDIKHMEADILRQLLEERFHGNRERLCQAYNISKTTLWRKLNLDQQEV